MTTNVSSRQKRTGTDARITGPHTGFDKYGRADHQYFHCRRCGAESTTKRDLYGCC